MTVTAPETELRRRVIELLTTEFTPEGIVFHDDKLHDSLGTEGPIGGVYPGPATPDVRNKLVLKVSCYVQLFGQWSAVVDPKQEVSPATIEEWAERLRRRLQTDTQPAYPHDSHVWFYEVGRIEYPDDPTGNSSRLLAQIMATTQNPALTETTG